jgi:hypothetical protein
VSTDFLVTLDDGTVTVALTDTGPRDHAHGVVRVDAAGVPAAYVVAPGDTTTSIANRLCTSVAWIGYLNQIRRQPFMSPEFDEIYAGDTLNLDPYTITTVGDINGSVKHYEPGTDFAPLPPQR